MQTYLTATTPLAERRVRQQRSGEGYLYFYTEKRVGEDGKRWVTEKPISEKEYIRYLMESDLTLHSVRKTKYRFNYAGRAMEIDVYPFSKEKAMMFVYGHEPASAELPEEIGVIRDVTGDPEYKNRRLAVKQVI
jgi:CYTH domain-containing protein